jgi:hypothetical protein
MVALNRAKWTVLIGYAVAAVGMVVFTQLDRVANMGTGSDLLNVAGIGSAVATLGGFVTATVGSAIWARRDLTRRPIGIATAIAGLSLLLALAFGVNIHGRTAMFMLLVPLALINLLSLLLVKYW